MFNGKGELIGLAFDGNWDSLSSDINFDKRLARCIGVDIRYVLYLMDKWGHADRLSRKSMRSNFYLEKYNDRKFVLRVVLG